MIIIFSEEYLHVHLNLTPWYFVTRQFFIVTLWLWVVKWQWHRIFQVLRSRCRNAYMVWKLISDVMQERKFRPQNYYMLHSHFQKTNYLKMPKKCLILFHFSKSLSLEFSLIKLCIQSNFPNFKPPQGKPWLWWHDMISVPIDHIISTPTPNNTVWFQFILFFKVMYLPS